MSGGVEAAGERSVAAGGNIGRVTTGDHVTQIEHAVVLSVDALARVECPDGLTNIPFKTDMFVGRQSELDALDRALAERTGLAVQAVHGLGGVGKSTLAAHWVATRATGRTVVWWITAESAADIDAGLAELAVALCPSLVRALPPEGLKEAALRWLADHDDWVIVLDNVSDPADIEPLLARARHGRILVTSRRTGPWHRSARCVPLDVLSQAEAVDLITRILRHGGRRDADGAEELCAELGRLPLALEQAAAFCVQAALTPRAFLGMLAAYPADMLDATVDDRPGGGRDSRTTIARIWNLTLDRLGEDPWVVLMVLAWFAADGTPRSLLEEELPERPPVVARALARLAAHSMITLRGDGTVSVHRLVQAVSRSVEVCDPDAQVESIDPVEDARALATLILLKAAMRSSPRDPAHWPRWRVLLPHVEALAEHASAETDLEETVTLFNEAGSFLIEQGNPRRGIDLLQRAESSAVRLLGEQDRLTLAVRNNLAVAHDEAGDRVLALEMYDLLLRDLDQVAGVDDPDTLNTLNNIACAERACGNSVGAIRLYDVALPRLTGRLGPDDRRVLSMRNNRAFAHWEAGREAEARMLMEELHAHCLAALGERDSTTLNVLHNLGYFAVKQVQGARAVPILEAAVEGRSQVLGPYHPDTLSSQSSLAMAHLANGEPGRALALAEETLAACERELGPGHPTTSAVRNPHGFIGLIARSLPDTRG